MPKNRPFRFQDLSSSDLSSDSSRDNRFFALSIAPYRSGIANYKYIVTEYRDETQGCNIIFTVCVCKIKFK